MPMDWILGLIGGLLIGGAAALFLLVNGRIMGASGLLGGLVDGSGRSDAGERLALIAGLVVVPGVIALATGGAQTNLTSNMSLIIVAGVLVGIGTRLANGCTSGHGVCGISRLSLRGIVATLIYIGAGAVTIAALRGIVGAV
ncbi:YeeE/YedE family protein [Loktanella sp. R86503]|uniref:YeeE/YedE family protein n=1 Tax=Loktanella sp. R86503 TaxID=3093847 RepID=UPI0036DDCF8C